MDKFLELSFRNHLRNHDEIGTQIEKCFEPVMDALRERLSKKACDDIEEILSDCEMDVAYIAGVTGMELAIGVINGTIEQKIEA